MLGSESQQLHYQHDFGQVILQLWAMGIKILSRLQSLVGKILSTGPGGVNLSKCSLFSVKHWLLLCSSHGNFHSTVSDEKLGMYIGIPWCQLVHYFRFIFRLTLSPQHYANFFFSVCLPACPLVGPPCLWTQSSIILSKGSQLLVCMQKVSVRVNFPQTPFPSLFSLLSPSILY